MSVLLLVTSLLVDGSLDHCQVQAADTPANKALSLDFKQWGLGMAAHTFDPTWHVGGRGKCIY